MLKTDDPAAICLRYIHQTNRSIFLTGKAGTGKTTLLRRIIEESHKQTIVVAPTGIAALNAGGTTIHSMFYLPFATFIPDYSNASTEHFSGAVKLETRNSLVKHFVYNKNKKKLLQNLELLIIDEVSMLRADVLDAIDWALRHSRKINVPFGGVQMLFIGDLLQLPPVYKPEEWNYLKHYYRGIHFFNALALQHEPPVYIELEKIYRQSDQKFISVLNELRNNQLSFESLSFLNSYVQADFNAKPEDNYITLTTHNKKADTMNAEALTELKTEPKVFKAIISGNFPESIYPVDAELTLKPGAQVMFIKNDLSYEKRYFNGKIGVLESFAEGDLFVRFPSENKVIKVDKYEWENISYELNDNTNEIEEKVLGTFVHYPLKLAWAITIHKSQGLTFDKAILDVSQVFAPGQAYVALSRLRSVDGLVLKTPFKINGITNDVDVIQYARSKASLEDLNAQLEGSVLNYMRDTLVRTFEWNELEEIWRKHNASYIIAASKSEKAKNRTWSETQFMNVKAIVDVAKKFIVQIDKIFTQPQINLLFVNERLEKAYGHFYKQLDDLIYSVLKKRYELSTVKKVKEYQTELEEIDDKQIEIMLRLKRVKNLFQAIVSGQEISKADILTQDIQEYRKSKFLSIQAEKQSGKSTLDFDTIHKEEELTINKLLKNIKKENEKVKTEKIPSHLITLESFRKGKTTEEIAQERMLTVDTITSHLTKLIALNELSVGDVFSEEQLQKLKQLFEKSEELTLSQMKEQTGDDFSWEELRMYRAGLI